MSAGQNCASPSSKSQTFVRTRRPNRGLPSDMRKQTRMDASVPTTKEAPSAGRRTPRLQRNRFNYSFVRLASGSASERSPSVSPSARDLWTVRGQNRRSSIQRANCSSCAVLQFLLQTCQCYPQFHPSGLKCTRALAHPKLHQHTPTAGALVTVTEVTEPFPARQSSEGHH